MPFPRMRSAIVSGLTGVWLPSLPNRVLGQETETSRLYASDSYPIIIIIIYLKLQHRVEVYSKNMHTFFTYLQYNLY